MGIILPSKKLHKPTHTHTQSLNLEDLGTNCGDVNNSCHVLSIYT